VTILQLKYAFDRQTAKDEIDRHLAAYEMSLELVRVSIG